MGKLRSEPFEDQLMGAAVTLGLRTSASAPFPISLRNPSNSAAVSPVMRAAARCSETFTSGTFAFSTRDTRIVSRRTS